MKIAIFGGKGQERNVCNIIPENYKYAKMVFYPSAKDGGIRHTQRLIESIKHGSLNAVFVLSRWAGHSSYRAIKYECNKSNIPVFVV